MNLLLVSIIQITGTPLFQGYFITKVQPAHKNPLSLDFFSQSKGSLKVNMWTRLDRGIKTKI